MRYLSLAAAVRIFLSLNGQPFSGPGLDFAKKLEAIATRSVTLDEATRTFEEWLRSVTSQ